MKGKIPKKMARMSSVIRDAKSTPGAEWVQISHKRPDTGTEVFNATLSHALMERAQKMESKSHAACIRIKFKKSEVESFAQDFSAEVKPNACTNVL